MPGGAASYAKAFYHSGGFTQIPGAALRTVAHPGQRHVHLFWSRLISATNMHPCPFSGQRMRLSGLRFVYLGRPSRNSKYSCCDAQCSPHCPCAHLNSGPGPTSSGGSATCHAPESCFMGASCMGHSGTVMRLFRSSAVLCRRTALNHAHLTVYCTARRCTPGPAPTASIPALHICLAAYFGADSGFRKTESSIGTLTLTCVRRIFSTTPLSVRFMR